jgi:hypothetical protein
VAPATSEALTLSSRWRASSLAISRTASGLRAHSGSASALLLKASTCLLYSSTCLLYCSISLESRSTSGFTLVRYSYSELRLLTSCLSLGGSFPRLGGIPLRLRSSARAFISRYSFVASSPLW